MTGKAVALIACGAKVSKPTKICGHVVQPVCNARVVADLEDWGVDGTVFDVPDGWHVELATKQGNGYHVAKTEEYPDGWFPGHQATETIVRCPKHCKWVPDNEISIGNLFHRGHWEDSE